MELNAKLSRKNAELQSENTTLSNKVCCDLPSCYVYHSVVFVTFIFVWCLPDGYLVGKELVILHFMCVVTFL